MNNANSNKEPRKKALGRGLGALIPRQLAEEVAQAGPSSPDYFICALDKISPCATQPRKHFDPEALRDLSASIKESGLIQPLVVRKVEGAENYELIAGERRWRASQMAGLTEVPVVLKDVSDAIAFALALIENIQRQDLNPVEEALAYQRLIEEFGFKQAELAEQVGKSRAAISNAIRLLQLPQDVLERLASNELSAGHARALLTLDPEDASALSDMILDQQLTVRDVEQRVRAHKAAQELADGTSSPLLHEPVAAPLREPEVEASEETLVTPEPVAEAPAPIAAAPVVASPMRDDDTTRSITSRLGSALRATVRLRDHHGKGSLEIQYDDYQTLKKLLEALDLDIEL